ncbi:hypothetical protein DFJ77DRAFT_17118 [Powellomyces hirtus]|nr:hypothetical protein DFJ77DRAFT_17118 [Powellomyces hirtus]
MSGRYCQVELVGSESKVAEKTLLRAKPFDAQHQYPCDERIEASAMSPIFLPSWLGERWSKCTSVDPATLLSTIWGSVSVSAVPGNGQDLPTANGLLLRKLGDVPWVPTTEGLRCVRATGQKSSMDFMDFPAIIGKSIGQMVMVNSVFTVPLLGRRAIFRIEKISGDNSADALRIALFEPETTAIELGTPVRDDMGSLPESLGGYEEEADELAGLIETAFYHSQAHERLGISPVRAVLLSGPSGVAAANRVAEKDGIPSEEVVAPLVRCIEKAKLTAPAVVILDGIELLDEDFKAPNFDRSSIASYISSQIQRIGSSSGVCVIASAIDLRRLPKSLQRNEEGGGFDRVIEMSVPDRRQREMILRHLLAKIPLFMDNDLEFLDDATCIGAYAYRVSQVSSTSVSIPSASSQI